MSDELLFMAGMAVPALCIVLMICWGCITDVQERPVSDRITLARLVNEHDAASSMRFGFLMTVAVCCLCALIGVCTEFDCTAFWSCLGGTFTAAFAAKGWQRATELKQEAPAA